MTQSKNSARDSSPSLSDAFVDFVFEASEEQIDEALSDNGEDPEAIAERAELAIDRAIARVDMAASLADTLETPEYGLHQGLNTLLDQLMRRDSLDLAQLADRADVAEDELRQIRTDAAFRPSLRTLYQLENHFKLPARSLGVLSGAVKMHSRRLEDEVTRFAAHSGRDFGKLSREERRELSQFISLLAEFTDGEGET
jgi:transcriptional regulator with XRE-family HTH domain